MSEAQNAPKVSNSEFIRPLCFKTRAAKRGDSHKKRLSMPDLWGNTSEEEMYQMALAVPLADKVQMAIALIREFEKQALALHEDGYYVAFSGGKDSIVLEHLFKLAGVKYKAWYNNVTIDPPELVQFIKRYYPEVQWNSVGIPLPYYMAKKSNGPPTRLSRWCCEVYKEQGGTGKFKGIGVRAEESPRRKGLWKTVNNNNGGTILCPILYWTEVDIWDFIRSHNMPYCSLYDEGFKRLGCIGCPMSGNQRKVQFDRWPQYETMWKRGFQRYWDAWKGVPRQRINKAGNYDRWIERMNSVEELWQWWMQEDVVNDTDQPDCQMYLW